jgi:hypothetical protein
MIKQRKAGGRPPGRRDEKQIQLRVKPAVAEAWAKLAAETGKSRNALFEFCIETIQGIREWPVDATDFRGVGFFVIRRMLEAGIANAPVKLGWQYYLETAESQAQLWLKDAKDDRARTAAQSLLFGIQQERQLLR